MEPHGESPWFLRNAHKGRTSRTRGPIHPRVEPVVLLVRDRDTYHEWNKRGGFLCCSRLLLSTPLVVQRLFFRGNDCVLKCFGRPNLDDSLCWDLDRFAGGRVSTRSSLSFDKNGFTNTWKHKSTLFLRLSRCQSCIFINNGCSGLLGNFKFFCKVCNDLSFCHQFLLSHFSLLFEIRLIYGVQYKGKALLNQGL